MFLLELEHHDAGKTLFRIGDPVGHIYLVASGEIQIFIEMDEREVLIDTLREGCCLGFNSVLKDANNIFIAKCTGKVSLYKLSKEKLKSLYNTCEDLYEEVKTAKKMFKSEEIPCIDF